MIPLGGGGLGRRTELKANRVAEKERHDGRLSLILTFFPDLPFRNVALFMECLRQ
jgi:hypothetical protein